MNSRSCIQRSVVIYVRTSLILRLRFFFFFQAEDGIRDLIVTGVQTCALPISVEAMALSFAQRDLVVATHGRGLWVVPVGPLEEMSDTLLAEAAHLFVVPPAYQRSEERRVGKECRSRWSPYH